MGRHESHRGAVMKAEQLRLPRFAVLIDAENTSPQIASGLFEEVAKFGEASVRRIYGDFSGTKLKSWSDILQKHAIDPYQQFSYTRGKNASDIALVIDAMDLLHSGRFDGFCLVSSDSDFTRLASRLREQGADVYGFGKQKTPESFRQACRRFIYTENLLPQTPASDSGTTPKSTSLQPPSTALPVLKKATRRKRRRPRKARRRRENRGKAMSTSAKERETQLAALDASIIRGLADAAAGRVTPADVAFDRVESMLRSKTGNEAVRK
jgi:uncharacterized LabA/DUF88 family protein/predicted transcriptional regulator